MKLAQRDSFGENGCRLSELLYMLSEEVGEMLPVIFELVEKFDEEWRKSAVYKGLMRLVLCNEIMRKAARGRLS